MVRKANGRTDATLSSAAVANGDSSKTNEKAPVRSKTVGVKMGNVQHHVSGQSCAINLGLCGSNDAPGVAAFACSDPLCCFPLSDPGAGVVKAASRMPRFRPPPGLPNPEWLIRLASDVAEAPDSHAVCAPGAEKESDKGGNDVSCGSIGHPDTCYTACRFFRTTRGCKDGASCSFCHRCQWNNSLRSAKNKAAALAKRDARLVCPEGQP